METIVENTFEEQTSAQSTPFEAEDLHTSDLHPDSQPPGDVPQKLWLCARGFTEAEWNDAFKQWVDLSSYCEDDDSDFDLDDYLASKKRKFEGNVNGVLGEVDELDLVAIEPESIPDHISKLFAKHNPAAKRKRRDLTVRQKLAILKWMDFAYPSGKFNFSEISRKTCLDRKTIREWLRDRDFIETKVKEVKQSGSTKKYGGIVNKKRFRVEKPQFPTVDEALLNFVDEKSSDNLPLSRKILRRKSRHIANDLGFTNFKGSPGYIEKFLKRNQLVPRTVTGSGQLIPHDACAQANAFIADVGETQLTYKIQPRKGKNAMMDETPLWWSMAAKKTIAKVGTKIIPVKSSGHDNKRYSVVLCGFDDNKKAIPAIIFKNLKKVPAEVKNRKDCFVAVAKGGSMTPEVLKLWLRKVWAKRPTKDMFRRPNILGWDMHYSHLDEEVVDTLKTVSNTIPKYVPGGMTSIMAGPDTHWNKSFKGKMHGKMDEWLDTEEYEMTKSGKIKPAPYKKICDWVVEAWNEIPDGVIGNAFVHNGWEQAHNGNDTSVLHQVLRDVVDNNIVRGYQRRATPEQAAQHNELVAVIREEMLAGDDADSEDELSEEDDFDFYRLQAAEDQQEVPHGRQVQTVREEVFLPADDVDFSDEETEEEEEADNEGISSEDDSDESEAASAEGTNAEESEGEIEF